MTLNPVTPEHLRALEALLPDGRVGPAPESYLEEPRGRYRGTSAALVRPASTQEVAEVVRFAARERIGIIPYAGGTGLVGGQTAQGLPTLLLSVERLQPEPAINTDDNVAVVGAGMILADVQAAAEAQDRLFPLSLASEGSARIGGLLGTNAGGIGVLRYGNARELCLGVEAVLADGSILSGLRRLRKDNSGYDLRNLLIGSEGTLGIITAACLRLFPRPREEATAFVTTDSPASAVGLLGHMREHLGEALSAFELISRQGLDFLAETLPQVARPFAQNPPWSVLIEAGGGHGAGIATRMEEALGAAFEAGLIGDALVSQNETQSRAFWAVRENLPQANREIGALASHDISVPISEIAAFVEKAGPGIARVNPGFRINCFGHLGDGNLHYNIFPPPGETRAMHESARPEVTGWIHRLATELGGSVSAEHGIGRLKTGDMVRFGDPVKLAVMRQIKAALDPHGILNPGAVIPGQD